MISVRSVPALPAAVVEDVARELYELNINVMLATFPMRGAMTWDAAEPLIKDYFRSIVRGIAPVIFAAYGSPGGFYRGGAGVPMTREVGR